jgi:Holliday junction resolvase RusA-like endonuclease
MDVRLILPGSVRSKKNSKQPVPIPAKGKTRIKALIGNQWRYAQIVLQPSKAYRAWEKEARWAAKTQYKAPPVEHDVHVQIHAYYKGRMPDLSGAKESVGDCLEGILWKDDRQIRSWDGSRLYHDLKNPRTEVIVREYHEQDRKAL